MPVLCRSSLQVKRAKAEERKICLNKKIILESPCNKQKFLCWRAKTLAESSAACDVLLPAFSSVS